MDGGKLKGGATRRQPVPTRSTRRHWVWLGLVTALAAGAPVFGGPGPLSARAATSTVVSLTFDNDTLQRVHPWLPAGAPAARGERHLLREQRDRRQHLEVPVVGATGYPGRSGDEIGGKTVDGTNLTTLTTQQQINEICNDRQTIMRMGSRRSPSRTRAGPGLPTPASRVRWRTAGMPTPDRRAAYLPPAQRTRKRCLPANWLALRAYAPSGQITLANLEALVTGAATNGGWVPIVIQKVCSQTQDPSNYTTCTASSGWIDLADLNTFLTWVQNAGLTGGAPSGSVFQTIGAAATSADTVAASDRRLVQRGAVPDHHIRWDGLGGADCNRPRLRRARTRYTTDGTTPTASSPTYNGPSR